MDNFLTFLGEAWPPSKNGPPQGGNKSPFGNSAGPKKSKPSFGDQGTPKKGLTPEHPAGPAKKPPFGPKAPSTDDGSKPPFGESEPGEDGGPNGAFGQQGPMDAEAIRAQQEIEQQQMEMEAEIQRQKAEKEAMERQKVKNMRAQADADVMDALADKYNDDTDYVEFYPDMLTFTAYNNEVDKQNEKAKKQQGATPSSPITSTTVASGGSGAAVGAQTSSDIETGNKGETPKVPDAAKSKSDLKKKKITGTESDDIESLAQPPVSDESDEEEEIEEPKEKEDELETDELNPDEDENTLEGEDEETDEDTEEDNPVKSPEEEQQQAQGNSSMMGQGERKIFKIKPADHISGSKFVGQGDFEDEQGDEEEMGEEGESSESPFGKSKGEGKPPFGKNKEEGGNPFAKGKKPGADEGEDEEEDKQVPTVKKFGEFNKGKKTVKEAKIIPFPVKEPNLLSQKSECDDYANMRIGYILWKGTTVQLVPHSAGRKTETWKFHHEDQAKYHYYALYKMYRDEGYQ